MSVEQQRAYDEATTVESDALGLIDRDNRNHRKKQDIILAHSHARAGDRLLEVGCGHGLHAPGYAEHFRYRGIDASESLIEACGRRLERHDCPHWGVEQMDARDLRYDDDSFDAVVGTAILHHLPDIEAGLREWMRVTKPAGSVTLVEPNYCFPKDFVSAHLVDEERHKTQFAPWRVRAVLEGLDRPYRLEPYVYTPPWPDALNGAFDAVDRWARAVPYLRWTSQLLLIHVSV